MRRNLLAPLFGYSVMFRVERTAFAWARSGALAQLQLAALGFLEAMPVPPPRERKDIPELTELARMFHPKAFVELADRRAYLDLLGTRFDLGDTMRTSRAELERQIEWFSKALASARSNI